MSIAPRVLAPTLDELDQLLELAAADVHAIDAYEAYVSALAAYDVAKIEGREQDHSHNVQRAFEELREQLSKNPNGYSLAEDEVIEFDPES